MRSFHLIVRQKLSDEVKDTKTNLVIESSAFDDPLIDSQVGDLFRITLKSLIIQKFFFPSSK